MPYKIEAFSSGDERGSRNFRIYNSSGSFIELTNLGCTLKQIHICREDYNIEEDLLLTHGKTFASLPAGSAVFEINGNIIDMSDTLWTIESTDDNAITFITETHDGKTSFSFLVKVTWMDHERLVIDFFAKSTDVMRPSATIDMLFSLGAQGAEGFNLKRYCKQAVSENFIPGGVCLFYTDKQGIHPTAEVSSDESGLSVSAYTTMPCCLIKLYDDAAPCTEILQGNLSSFESPVPLEEIPAGAVWHQRIIYGFDPIYKGPEKVFPFAF